MDSQCKYGVVARGEGEIILRLLRPDWVESIWDVAAGLVVVREAGGTVTDSAGRPLDFTAGRNLLC
jgi:3'-phosphoadenosine 5'-phosphosulfate (PAPS) 3'-phosphatase